MCTERLGGRVVAGQPVLTGGSCVRMSYARVASTSSHPDRMRSSDWLGALRVHSWLSVGLAFFASVRVTGGRVTAGLECHYSGWLHGLTMLTPRGSKCLVFRVAMVIPALWATAAMSASSRGAWSGTG